MGATDLTFDCPATTFQDILLDYKNEIKREKEYGYNSDSDCDGYEGNVLGFDGIVLLSDIANTRNEALTEVLNKSEKWGPALAKMYKYQEFDKKKEKDILKNKKKVQKNLDLYEKKKKEKIQKILDVSKTKPTGFLKCFNCKSQISNKYINTSLTICGKNKCVICNKPIVNLSKLDTKIQESIKEYNNIEYLYKAVWGGMVSC